MLGPIYSDCSLWNLDGGTNCTFRGTWLMFVPGPHTFLRGRKGRQLRGFRAYTEADAIRAMDCIHDGASLRQAEMATGVPEATIRRLLKRCTEHGSVPCKGANRRTWVAFVVKVLCGAEVEEWWCDVTCELCLSYPGLDLDCTHISTSVSIARNHGMVQMHVPHVHALCIQSCKHLQTCTYTCMPAHMLTHSFIKWCACSLNAYAWWRAPAHQRNCYKRELCCCKCLHLSAWNKFSGFIFVQSFKSSF